MAKMKDVIKIIEEAARTGATELNLAGRFLTELPPEIGKLINLTTLSLHESRLRVLPPEIGKLTKLTTLYFMNNQLRVLPPEIGKLTNLTTLNLWGNRLTALPAEIGKLTNLTELDLSENRLTVLPPEIGKLISLTGLDLGENQFTVLPPETGKLTNLTRLDLSGNQLAVLPPEIGKLTNLTTLYLWGNQLTVLPPETGKLTNLTILGLSGNKLAVLPVEIGKLTNLTGLGLSENQLTVLPPEIGKLTNLTALDLTGNQLTVLPPEIGKLSKLERVYIDGNPLPAEILQLAEKRGLIAYLREVAQKEEEAYPFNEAKLLLIGPGEVGKTWLLNALQGKVPVSMGATAGIEIAREPLDIGHPREAGRILHFNCWDFGGQDQYQVTHQIFFSQKAIYLLVWKPRKGPDRDLSARLERIELSAGRTARVFIVSTHADGTIPAEIGEQAIEERFGDLIGGFFKVDSAKGPEGTGIASLRDAIAQAAAQLEGMDVPFPIAWHKASRAIRELKEPTLTFGRFARIISGQGLKEDLVESLAGVMNVQGHIVYFSEAARSGEACVSLADNLVVLNPEWLAKAVGSVMMDAPTVEDNGVLKHGRLPAIWHEFARGCINSDDFLCGYLLWLIWKFDIAYRLDEQTSLVPEMIHRNRPDDLRWTPAIESCEKQATLIGSIGHDPPLGLIPVFTTAVHPLRRMRQMDKEPDPWDRNWRDGFFLDTFRRGTAFVELQDRDLLMTVRDAYPAHLLDALRKTLGEVIKGRWPNLNIDYRIPCLGHMEGKRCRGSFKLSYLESRKGQEISCQDCGNDNIPVDKLLEGYDMREEQMMSILKKLATGQQDYMALALKMYHDFLDPERAELERAPCMISILPGKGGKWNLLGKATKQFYRVTCWCEHPDGPHPGAGLFSNTPPDYQLKMPREWVVEAAPYLSWFSMLAKTFVPLAGKMVANGLGELLDRSLKQNIELMGEVAKSLPSGKLEPGLRDELSTGSIYGHRPETAALRHIHDVLLSHIPAGQRWGDLRPVRTKAHGLLWLCARHAAIQEPPVQRIVGDNANVCM